MGLDVSEEFRPITPVRTVAAARTKRSLSDLEEVKEEEEEEECRTPRSAGQLLKSTADVCPAAPRKPPAAKRRLRPKNMVFFKVPRDLASVFLVLTEHQNSKKIRPNSASPCIY